jgi:tripartite-type tricarboxylate transporter receptor subunit TctC
MIHALFGVKTTGINRRAFAAGTCALALTSSLPARAQAAYPTRPVKVIVPTGAGAAIDTAARGLAAQLEKYFGSPFVIENKPGASAAIGSEYVARAAPDGYTLIYASQSLTVNPSLYKLSFDTATAFAPIATVANAPIVLTVPLNSRFRSVRELIAAAKGENLSYGSAGLGSPPYLSAELFAQKAGVKFTHVPYKAAAQALTDLLGDRLDLMFPSLSLAQGFIGTEKLRVLGIASNERSALAPDIPTISEMGLPGFVSSAWSGILAPAGTPEVVVEKLERAIQEILQKDEAKRFLISQGLDWNFRDHRAFAEFFRQEIANWSRILADTKSN